MEDNLISIQRNDEDVDIDNRSMVEFTSAKPHINRSCIVAPTIQARNYEIKISVMQMIQNSVMFRGSPSEDPHEHLSKFLSICDSFRQNGVSSDAVRLKLFPFSLNDKAWSWLNSLPVGSISTWEQMEEAFFDQYFPPSKISQMRNEITTFRQQDFETFVEAWERFKGLLIQCPYLDLPRWRQLEAFYNGLTKSSRKDLNLACNRSFLKKSYVEGRQLLETMRRTCIPIQSFDRVKKAAGVHEIDALTSIQAQIAALTRKFDSVKVNVIQGAQVCYDICRGNHLTDQCSVSMEEANVLGSQRNNPYFNTYNPGWRNHPNFSWKGTQEVETRAAPPPGLQLSRPKEQEKKSSFEELMIKYVANQDAILNNQAA